MTDKNHSAEADTAQNVVDIRTTTKRNAYGEWVVRLFENGEFLADYHTNDPSDAYETATAVLKEATVNRRTVWHMAAKKGEGFGKEADA